MASPGDAILGLCDNDLEHLSNSVFSRIEKDRPSGEPINKPGLWSSWVDGGCPTIVEPCSRFVEVLLRNESEDTEKGWTREFAESLATFPDPVHGSGDFVEEDWFWVMDYHDVARFGF